MWYEVKGLVKASYLEDVFRLLDKAISYGIDDYVETLSDGSILELYGDKHGITLDVYRAGVKVGYVKVVMVDE